METPPCLQCGAGDLSCCPQGGVGGGKECHRRRRNAPGCASHQAGKENICWELALPGGGLGEGGAPISVVVSTSSRGAKNPTWRGLTRPLVSARFPVSHGSRAHPGVQAATPCSPHSYCCLREQPSAAPGGSAAAQLQPGRGLCPSSTHRRSQMLNPPRTTVYEEGSAPRHCCSPQPCCGSAQSGTSAFPQPPDTLARRSLLQRPRTYECHQPVCSSLARVGADVLCGCREGRCQPPPCAL